MVEKIAFHHLVCFVSIILKNATFEELHHFEKFASSYL